MGDSPSAWTEMIWRMKKTDPTPWRKVRENLREPEAIALLAKPSAAGGWLPRLFLSPPLHFCSGVCSDDFKELFPSAGSCVLGLHWRREGWKKKEGGREESLAWLVWRGGEGWGGRCPASWGWGEAVSSPVCRAVHAESRCEKSHYPVGKYLMDHGGKNVKARREREKGGGGGGGQATSRRNPWLRGEGQLGSGAGTRWVCGLSCASPKGWVQTWGAFCLRNLKSASGALLRVVGQGLLQQERQFSGKGWGKVTNGMGPWQPSLPEDWDWDGLILLFQILGLGQAWGIEGRSRSPWAGLCQYSWSRWMVLVRFECSESSWWKDFPAHASSYSTDICPLFSFYICPNRTQKKPPQ